MRSALTPGVRSAFIGQGFSSGGSFLLTMLLVRALGLTGFGELSLLLILCGYAAGLVQALVAQPLLSLGALVPLDERRGQVRDALSMALLLAGLLGGVAATVVAAAGALVLAEFGSSSQMSAGGAACLVALRALQPAVRAGLHSLERRRWTPAYDAVAPWAACAAVLTGAVGEGDVRGALMLLCAATGLGLAVGWIGLRSVIPRRLPRGEALSRHWESGRWLAGNQVLSWVGSGSIHASTVVVLGPLGVGAIRAAQSIVGAVLVAAQALELALPARAAGALVRGGQGELNRWCWNVAHRLALAFFVLGGALVYFAPWFITRWMPSGASIGPDLISEALQGLAWLPAATVLGIVLQVRLRATRDTRCVFVAYASASLMSALVAVPLVTSLGVLGAAIGLTMGQAIFSGLLALRVRSGAPLGMAALPL